MTTWPPNYLEVYKHGMKAAETLKNDPAQAMRVMGVMSKPMSFILLPIQREFIEFLHEIK